MPNLNVGASIERVFGRSAMRTKSGLKGRYSLAETWRHCQTAHCRQFGASGRFSRRHTHTYKLIPGMPKQH
jgi:hypothetical protein